jgi:hypothetical protein
MRAVTALLIGIAPLVVACEGVPDLHFAGPEDAATSQLDATIGALDSSGGQSSRDATIATDARADDDAQQPAMDSAPPPPPTDAAGDASGSDGSSSQGSCPNNPPAGVTCCGSVECKGTAAECNCSSGLCQYCASEGVCCPSAHPPQPGTCATKLSDCP